jgi:hypothetical protein
MTPMQRLRRQLSQLAIPNLTIWQVMGQVTFYVLSLARRDFLGKIVFLPAAVLEGEWWRLLTFLFVPPAFNPLFLFLALWFFFFIGTALENAWGAARYNLYLLVGYVATVGVAFLFPMFVATNIYVASSVFFAFAMLFPNTPINLYFVITIRVKWLALFDAVLIGWSFCFGPWQAKILILASFVNFLLFFRKEIVEHARLSSRQRKNKAKRVAAVDLLEQPFHICAVCGINDKTHRQMDFRYCPGCGGKLAYCTEHLNNHEHRVPAA